MIDETTPTEADRIAAASLAVLCGLAQRVAMAVALGCVTLTLLAFVTSNQATALSASNVSVVAIVASLWLEYATRRAARQADAR